jgi:hypothetical protein
MDHFRRHRVEGHAPGSHTLQATLSSHHRQMVDGFVAITLLQATIAMQLRIPSIVIGTDRGTGGLSRSMWVGGRSIER